MPPPLHKTPKSYTPLRGFWGAGHFAPCTSPYTTDLGFSYSARGEVTDTYESTPDSTTYFHASQTYLPNGGPNQLTGNIGLPSTITYGADGEGRPTTVSASGGGQNPVTAAAYNLYASPNQLQVTFGSADTDTFSFDPNTFHLNKYQFKIGAQTVTGTLGWNSNASLGTFNISDPFSAANTQNCTFAADDLARTSEVSCGTVWGQNFSYDPFGNITKAKISGTGATSFAPTYQSSPSITNRISQVGTQNSTYDANGNSLNDTIRTFTWDSDSNPITVGSATLTYDALDRMVEQTTGSTHSEIVYSPAGAKLSLMNGTALLKAFVPLPGGATAVYTASGLTYYRHTDHLGSSRFASTSTQTLYSDTAYSPFGEPYASSGALDDSFTGQNQDTMAGLYDFLYREYDPYQSRWSSPDRAGVAAANPAFPQSWNRYVYALNNPLGLVDRTGLYCEFYGENFGDETDVEEIDDEIDAAGCIAAGGGWFDAVTTVIVNGDDPGDGGIFSGFGIDNGFFSQLKNIARKVGKYIPLVCSGGVYNNAGVGTSGPVSVAISPHFQQVDFGLSQGNSYATYSEGVFAEISGGEVLQGGVGQAHTYGLGQSLANSTTTETFLFRGVGASSPFAGANASAFYATPSSFGISLSGNLLAFQGGVGGYVNVNSVTSCFGF